MNEGYVWSERADAEVAHIFRRVGIGRAYVAVCGRKFSRGPQETKPLELRVCKWCVIKTPLDKRSERGIKSGCYDEYGCRIHVLENMEVHEGCAVACGICPDWLDELRALTAATGGQEAKA